MQLFLPAGLLARVLTAGVGDQEFPYALPVPD
jgi:hypothetical protein